MHAWHHPRCGVIVELLFLSEEQESAPPLPAIPKSIIVAWFSLPRQDAGLKREEQIGEKESRF
jgi:hypothetical protein